MIMLVVIVVVLVVVARHVTHHRDNDMCKKRIWGSYVDSLSGFAVGRGCWVDALDE